MRSYRAHQSRQGLLMGLIVTPFQGLLTQLNGVRFSSFFNTKSVWRFWVLKAERIMMNNVIVEEKENVHLYKRGKEG